MDEPTAFIDNQTEDKIKSSSLSLKKICTTIIIIAHRISTVMVADKIGVMEDGRIVEIGTHNELITKDDGVYRRIFKTKLKARLLCIFISGQY
ncbi:MAG: hypothetical protein ACUVQ4_09265 [bacterium]